MDDYKIIRFAKKFNTDDVDGLAAIMADIKTDIRFDFMRKDLGSMEISSFVKDRLVMALHGNCYGCSRSKLTMDFVKDWVKEKYPLVTLVITEAKPPMSDAGVQKPFKPAPRPAAVTHPYGRLVPRSA